MHAPTVTSLRPRPIPNSYWATPLLLACEYPWTPSCPRSSTQKLDLLLKAGVRTFIDLTETGELSPYAPHLAAHVALLAAGDGALSMSDVAYHSFPIHDRSLPASPSSVHAILAVLRDNAERGRVCAVHCRGGIGRTGLVVGCWLVECGAARDGEDALRRIADEWKTVEKCRRFPCSPETGPQFEYVRNWRRGRGRHARAGQAVGA
ncbi:phosphatases II [Dentipellis sp. KUC8613]|nr:phosphatases II [Dentipellis sp. KUC8613]